nr:hypothetical protein [Actinomycetota bacterium]
MNRPDLTARVGTLTLPNPIMTASGTGGHGAELGAYIDLSALGAVVVKSLSPDPWAGNPPPRVYAAVAGMLNSVGLQNPGVGAWLHEDLPALAATGARVVVSIWGHTTRDYGRAAQAVADAAADSVADSVADCRADSRADSRANAADHEREPARAIVAVEANVSCPNIEDRRQMFAHSCAGTSAAIGAARAALAPTGLPVWAKL